MEPVGRSQLFRYLLATSGDTSGKGSVISDDQTFLLSLSFF